MSLTKTELLSQTVLAAFRASGALLHWGNGFAAQFGLTSARWQMLGALALSDEKLTAPQIAERMGVTRQGAQKQLDLLLQGGLIESSDNPQHRHSPLYELTRQGEALYRRIDAAWKVHTESAARHFPAADLQAALRALTRLADFRSL